MSPPVAFVLTGFGKFFDVEDNPTTKLIEWLSTDLEGGSDNFNLLAGVVLGVSGEDVREWLPRLSSLLASEPRPVVLLSLGVAKAECFRLETTAFNKACFRCPDERGWQPQASCIDEALPLDYPVACPLPLERIHVNLLGSGFRVELSSDPGRFVCNYLYYATSTAAAARPHCYSLFVHVPHFAQIDEPTQRRFVLATMRAVAAAAADAASGYDPEKALL
ncbi:hypothetical protein FOA52_015718 [Chlamydomonas sp. UWO 241]|nr:hypothetical protein FOA52_015718 [Chlamydomonas sp. UWO 241]